MSIDRRVHHDKESRRRAVELFEQGYGYEAVANLLVIPKDTMRQWLYKCRSNGSEGVLTIGGKQKKYTFEMKVTATKAVVDRGMSKLEAMKAYDIASLSSLERWCRLYRAGGEQALLPKPKGRPKGVGTKDRLKTHEQELEERIRKLEAENAYLKKSIALKAEMGLLTARKPQ